MGHEPPRRSRNASRNASIEKNLRHRELRAGLELLLEALELVVEVVGRRVDRHPEEERRRCVDLAPVVVLARVHAHDHLREPDRVDLVHAARTRVVAGLGRVARDGEDVADALGVRAEQHRLEPRDRRVARREVGDGLEADDALDGRGGDEPVHARPRARVVVHVDDIDVPGGLERPRQLEHRVRVPAARRIDLDGDDELAFAELSLKQRLALGLRRGDDDLALPHDELRARAAVLVDRVPDRRDLRRGRPAAATDDACAQLPCVRGELGEVLRRRVREDDALPGEARQPDVRQRGERLAALAHPLDCPERRLEPDSVVRADRGDVELRERGRRLLRRDAAERLRVLVEGEQADDRQRGARAHRPDRRDELVELVEGLDHEEVDATAFEQLCLLGEDGVAVLGRAAERARSRRR